MQRKLGHLLTNRRFWLFELAALGLILAFVLLTHDSQAALPSQAGKPPASGIIVGQDYHHDTSPPLSEMPQLPVKALPERDAESRNPFYASVHKDAPDGAVQSI